MSKNVVINEKQIIEKQNRKKSLIIIIAVSIVVIVMIVGLFILFMNSIGKTTAKEIAWVNAFRLKCTVQQIYMILLLLPIFMLFIYPIIPMNKGKKK